MTVTPVLWMLQVPEERKAQTPTVLSFQILELRIPFHHLVFYFSQFLNPLVVLLLLLLTVGRDYSKTSEQRTLCQLSLVERLSSSQRFSFKLIENFLKMKNNP